MIFRVEHCDEIMGFLSNFPCDNVMLDHCATLIQCNYINHMAINKFYQNTCLERSECT